jgi:hypothetical protein
MDALDSSIGNGNKTIPVATRKRLEHLCSFLRSWRRKTKGERIECRRHHLEYDLLSSFQADDVRLALALAKMERGDDKPTGCTVAQLVDWMRCELDGKSLLDVIFEFRDIEDYLRTALEKQKQLKEAEASAKRASAWKQAEAIYPEVVLPEGTPESVRAWFRKKVA